MMIQKTTETNGAYIVKLLTKRQSLGFEQSLTNAWNSTTSLFGHTDCLRRPVNTHTHNLITLYRLSQNKTTPGKYEAIIGWGFFQKKERKNN